MTSPKIAGPASADAIAAPMMFATLIWLLWVVARQAGATGALVALTGMLLLGFALWLLRFRSRILFTARLAVAVGTLGSCH